MQVLLDCRFPADTAQLQPVRHRVRAALVEHGCAHEFIETSVLALDEALSNVMRHGYPPGAAGELCLTIHAAGETVIFGIRDFAAPFDPCELELPPPGEARAGGYGLLLIREIMDSVHYHSGADGQGNLLQMTRRLERATR